MKKLTVFFLFVPLVCIGHTEENINNPIQDFPDGKCILIIKVSDFDSIPEANAKLVIWNVADSLGFSKKLISDIDGKSEITVNLGLEYNIKIFKDDFFYF